MAYDTKKAMSFDDMQDAPADSPVDKSPANDTGAESPDDSMEASEPAGESGTETATLSTEMLQGQDLKPGAEIKLRVTSVNPEDGTVTVAATKSGGGAISKAAQTFDMKG